MIQNFLTQHKSEYISRAKKQYTKLSEGAKPLFLQELRNLYKQN